MPLCRSLQSGIRIYKNVSDFVECLADIVEDVFCVLNANGEADEVGCHACFAQLLVAHLAVGMAGGMKHTGTRICHMGDDGNHLQGVHKTDGGFAGTFESEGHYAARTVRQVFLCALVVGVGGKSTVMNPCYARIGFEEFCYSLGVAAMLRHTQVKSLKTEVEQE